ncbi:deoxyguanosinetriphosphate triphosphohydrolase [Bacillus cereus]|uniref:deoxyguanosinetriphosphate triphosphohydrolase n=1 Tax=Bacillus TaxID=1386 RepID=UPI0023583851|nr:deoxyguanosinetriphosphate triphosphohydrolase [Bacillus cereus]WCT67213.1 deoxyguanosinetriphosphate triphosphohydrolase [Bacillus cereus]
MTTQIKFDWKEILNEKRSTDSQRNGGKQDYDKRNAFENDFDRITFSSSLRRLQDKAQVFPLEKKDYVRTRLTHSLEVSTLARSLGISVGRSLNEKEKEFTEDNMAEMSAILACAGLIHDIGNPPFGHFGEQAIRDWFKDYFTDDIDRKKERNLTHNIKIKDVENYSELSEQQKQDFLNFEGNAQALRLLTKLNFFIDDKGMNLTYGVLSSIIKYPKKSTEVGKVKEDIAYKKMGYFEAEEELFNEISKKVGIGSKRNPLTFLLEAADDIAYKAADIEDGLNKGVLTYEIIHSKLESLIPEKELKVYKETYNEIIKRNQEQSKGKVELGKELKIFFEDKCNYQMLSSLEGYYAKAQEIGYEDPSTYAIQRFRVSVQGIMMNAVVKSFMNNLEDIMCGEFRTELLKVSDANEISEALKQLAIEHIFKDKNVVRLEILGHRVICGLLDIFVPAVLSKDYLNTSTKHGKIYHLISTNYKFVNREYHCGEWGKDPSYLYNRLLLVTDFICSMTDSYALELYQELTGVKL